MFTARRSARTPSDDVNTDPYALWNPLLSQSTQDLGAVEDEPEYECRICLETPTDPCVTRCGHLYCVACLRQWLDFSPKCPACKSPSHMSQVVPIFGVRPGSPRSKHAPLPSRSSSSSTTSSSCYCSTDSKLRTFGSAKRHQRRSSSATASPAPSSLLLASPRPFQFTSEPSPTRTLHDEDDEPNADADDDGWDTDAELEFQLSQMPSIKLPLALADTGRGAQPYGRAISVVALAVMLTVLLK